VSEELKKRKKVEFFFISLFFLFSLDLERKAKKPETKKETFPQQKT